MEQMSNPNYLKGEVKGSLKYQDFNDYDNIPVAELDINVPLNVSGRTLPGKSHSTPDFKQTRSYFFQN
jgi:hypothetical protein